MNAWECIPYRCAFHGGIPHRRASLIGLHLLKGVPHGRASLTGAHLCMNQPLNAQIPKLIADVDCPRSSPATIRQAEKWDTTVLVLHILPIFMGTFQERVSAIIVPARREEV
jgi:hypothetical protein